ncbi:MAG: phospholipase D family protein [Acidimicrobiaceae bacterium]|nr:phospholipase D family protein [Acidimicrobiaceae bacterium]
MQYELRIQDPADPPRSLLLDEVAAIAEAGDVVWLRAFFGFLTRSGLDALLAVQSVREILLQHEVELLVGIDSVTDRPGLERLMELASQNSHFRPRVIKNTTGALVHPKLLAARYADGSTVAVVGSNNLTLNGLSGNVEAYTIARFEPDEEFNFADWDAFVTHWDPLISEIDDAALEIAESNTRRLRGIQTSTRVARNDAKSGVIISDGQARDTPLVPAQYFDELILVAQIPRAGGRWSQVHYSASIIQDYFRTQAGSIVHLRALDSVTVEKARVIFSQANGNYKIELAAARAAGAYPDNGRPVVLFRREGNNPRRFRYILLLPGNDGHDKMIDLTATAFDGPANQVPRVVLPRSQVLSAWPDCPL